MCVDQNHSVWQTYLTYCFFNTQIEAGLCIKLSQHVVFFTMTNKPNLFSTQVVYYAVGKYVY